MQLTELNLLAQSCCCQEQHHHVGPVIPLVLQTASGDCASVYARATDAFAQVSHLDCMVIVGHCGMIQAEEYTAADAEVMELMDQHDREKLDDPLSKLEHHTDVMIKKKAQNERLVDLRDDSNAKYKNDYEMNKLLRKNLRYVATMFMWVSCMVNI